MNDPSRELWKSLVQRANATESGYTMLSRDERLYLSVGLLDLEVYNGGMYWFFFNSSGSFYDDVVDGLRRLEADQSLNLLLQAKRLLFDDAAPPKDRRQRWETMKRYPRDGKGKLPQWCVELAAIEKAYCKDPDKLSDRLKSFAEESGLVNLPG